MTAALAAEIEDDEDAILRLTIAFDRRRPVSDQVYEALRKAIVSLRLPPGASISENRICRQIGVSRTPVRAAIIRLVEDGLIEVFPQKGSFVAPIKLSSVRVNHFIRKALELAVLRARGGGLDANAFRQLAPDPGAAGGGARGGGHRSVSRARRSVPSRVLRRGRARGGLGTIQIAKARVDRVHRLASGQGRLPLVISEHQAILDALDAGDARARRSGLDFHLEQAPSIMETLIGRFDRYFVD